MTTQSFGARLAESPVHQAFRNHVFFRTVNTVDLTTDQAAVLIKQWWHPLHYFPTFLARCVATLPDIAAKCAITRILSEETGSGEPDQAHEVIYYTSMEKCRFDKASVVGSEPFEETVKLVDGYARASEQRETALGFIFATETTDLLMVSSIGKAISRSTGVTDNEWVTIHVAQEPGHVEQANHALFADFTPAEERSVLAAAEEMWRLWIEFFDRLVIAANVAATASL